MKRSPLIILFITIFIDLLGFGLILPLLPVYITHYGGQPWVGGVLMSIYSIMQFIFAPIWGRASDRYGRRPLILLSLVGSALSYYFFGAAQSLLVLFIARASSGILSAASLPTAYAYIADVTLPQKRAGGMALIGAAFGLGFALGPALSGVLSQHPILGISSLAMPSYFAATLAILNFVWAVFMLPETNHDRIVRESKGMRDLFSGIGHTLQNPAVRAQMLVFLFTTFAFAAVESSFSWLTILRFQNVIVDTATRTWHGYAHLPLTALPLEVKKLIPVQTPWPAYAQVPLSAVAPAIAKQLTEKASSAITTSIFMIVGMTILVVQVCVMGGLARRVGEKRLIVAGTLILTCTLTGIAIAPSLLLIKILSACLAIGNGILNPSLTSLITQAAGPRERGTVTGAQQSLGSLARIIAPPINNSLVQVQTAIPFLSSALLMGIGFSLALKLKQPAYKEAASPVESMAGEQNSSESIPSILPASMD